jgi:hypothetical protein
MIGVANDNEKKLFVFIEIIVCEHFKTRVIRIEGRIKIMNILTGCGKTLYYRMLKKVQIQGARNWEPPEGWD